MRGLYLGLIVLLVACLQGMGSTGSSVDHAPQAVARVLVADNSKVTVIGSNRLGEQRLEVEMQSGEFDGKVFPALNLLSGSMEYDEFYQQGDRILVAIQPRTGDELPTVRALSFYRLPVLSALLLLFTLGLLIYARKVGFKAMLSFVGSVLIIWQLLIPCLLNGVNPLLATGLTIAALSALIILSVAGWTYKGKSALAGTLFGLLVVTTGLCLVAGNLLHLDGMSQPLAQVLLFETGMHLNMLEILFAAVIIGASGAAMDVAMEMAATMEEVKLNSPGISRTALLKSGFRVGSAVIGTMTTTLLLAYSGGFLTLLMLFMSRDTSLMQVLNMKLVASEIARTLIGSISLIIVAHVTAWISSWMLCRQQSPGMNTLSCRLS